ncbi:MAG: hypothetical protein J0L53_07150 [Spirochaetes bacterium]|nr:hypothetical protein [Spirochaetota bacterium]
MFEYLYLHNRKVIGEDIFTLVPNTKLQIPIPLTADIQHLAVSGETSSSLAYQYYGLSEFYARIDAANDWPAKIVPGDIYIVPALISPTEYAAAAELRKEINVEFDR